VGRQRHLLYHHTDSSTGANTLAQDWITNIYNPVWGPATRFEAPQISKTALRLASYGLVDTVSFAQDQVQLTVGVRRQEVLSDSFNVRTGRAVRATIAPPRRPSPCWSRPARNVALYANYIEGLSQGAAPMTAANAGEVFAPYKSKQMELASRLTWANSPIRSASTKSSGPAAMSIPSAMSFPLAASSATAASTGASLARPCATCA
jgi:iron complex outermembrane receptor protein